MGCFKIFSFDHLVAIALISCACLMLVGAARTHKLKSLINPISWTLACVAVGHELIWLIVALVLGQWHYSWGIPLQLCDLGLFAVGDNIDQALSMGVGACLFLGISGIIASGIDTRFNFYIP